MNAEGQEIWETVLKATEGKEVIVSGGFFCSNESGMHYCPLGCVVNNMAPTTEYDENFTEEEREYADSGHVSFFWKEEDTESKVEAVYGSSLYCKYDSLVKADEKLEKFIYGRREYLLPREKALEKFKQALEELCKTPALSG